MKIEEVKKINLGHYPTPVEKLDNLSRQTGAGPLYIKRDDLTGPALGGNKTRKLEYLLREALDTGCTAVITYGGVQTNHGRTTVGACVKLGLTPILVLYGSKPGLISGNLTLDYMMGADIYYLEEDARLPQLKREIFEKYEAMGDKIYDIPIGGSNALGGVGYVMAVPEILGQLAEKNITIDRLVCTVGSLGTFGGLVAGAKYFKADFEVIGVPVWPEAKGKLEHQTAKYCRELSLAYDMGITVQESDIKIAYGPEEAPYSGKAYNEPDSITREALLLLARTEAIFLDPTYTGKTFRGFLDLARDGRPSMFLHSGGWVAIWTREHLDDMQNQIQQK